MYFYKNSFINYFKMFQFTTAFFKFVIPFWMLIAGPDESGKEKFLIRFLNEYQTLMEPNPISILYCYEKYNDNIQIMKQGGVNIHKGIPDDDLLNSLEKPTLLILDSLNVSQRFLITLKHKSIQTNISVMFLTKRFHDEIYSFGRFFEYIVLMRNQNLVKKLYDDPRTFSPDQVRHLDEAYRLATSNSDGYLVINKHPSFNVEYLTNIFEEPDNEEFSIFVPKTNNTLRL